MIRELGAEMHLYTMIQNLINEIEREEREILNHKQVKPRYLNIEVLREMNLGQIKKAQEFFRIQEIQEQADFNISLVCRRLNE